MQIPAHCPRVAFGAPQLTLCLSSTLQSDPRPALESCSERSCSWERAAFPTELPPLTMTARLSEETFALI